MKITAYEHVGIRVSDRDEALAFYELLGFKEDAYFPDYPANEMTTASGVRINLIFNGTRNQNKDNVLFDTQPAAPGITHPAFVVDSLADVQAVCSGHEIEITEGPIQVDERRRAIFIRDPDGNVLEFDELI